MRRQARAARKEAALARAADPDAIHDMRVASRRLRAALSEFGYLFNKTQRRNVKKQARLITQLLGKARELDVCVQTLERLGEDAPALTAYLHRLRDAEAPHVEQAAALALDGALEARCEELLAAAETDGCLVTRARRRLTKRLEKLFDGYAAWERTRDEQHLHAVRILFKKFRYAAETYSRVYDGELKRIRKALKAAQELLGQWNDARVLRNYVLELAGTKEGKERAELDQLAARLDDRAADLQEAFEKRARRFFSAENRTRCLELLEKPAVTCCEERSAD